MNFTSKHGARVATAVALALSSATAMAATTPGASNILFKGGATATDRSLFEAMLDPGATATSGICTDGTTGAGADGTLGTADDTFDANVIADVYTTASSWDAANPSPANFSIHCVGKSTSTQIGTAIRGQPIGMYKFSGGSETGVETVANNVDQLTVGGQTINVTYADPASASCSAPTFVPQRSATPDRIAYRIHTGCGTIQGVPNSGVSDVNAQVFGSSTTTVSRLTQESAVQIVFTPVVSRNFYGALQTALGLTRRDTSGNQLAGPVACTTADTNIDCMPNLSLTQVRALMGGPGSAGTDTRVIKLASQIAGVAAPAVNELRLCRRGDSSGTQKSFELIYFGQNCGVTTTARMAEDLTNGCEGVGCTWNAATFGNSTIFQGTGSGDVDNCLTHANDNGRYAVGLQSSDRLPSASRRWNFIKINGVAPTVAAMVRGETETFVENVFTRPSASSPNTSMNGAAGANKLAIYNGILSGVRNPAVLAKTHSSQGFGRAGLTVRPTSAIAPLASDTDSTRPVGALIRATTRNFSPVNNCTAPQQSVATAATPDVLKPSVDTYL